MHVANPVVVPTALSPLIERYDRVDREIDPVLELKENLFLNLSALCHCKWLPPPPFLGRIQSKVGRKGCPVHSGALLYPLLEGQTLYLLQDASCDQ